MNKEIDIIELKEIQIKLLDTIHEFCVDNNIKYFMTAGTLIGALRHKGYIPWDDDIDLVMLRPDYERFINSFNDNRKDHISVVSHELGDECSFCFSKVCDNSTMFIEDANRKCQEKIGVNIDIFPLDSMTDDYNDAVILMKDIKKYTKIVSLKNIVSTKKRTLLKTIALYITKLFVSHVSYTWCFVRIDRIAKRFISNTNSKYIANAVILAKGEREILEREWFEEQIDLEFEGKLYKAPVGADSYMKRLFGDYMKLPPKEKQVSHHSFKAYHI